MKVFVIGATGFIGRNLIDGLVSKGHQVVALTRSAEKGQKVLGDKISIVEGNPTKAGEWQEQVDGCDSVIVMSGEPIVGKKWTAERKKLLFDSRLGPTANVIEAIKSAKHKPKALLCGSAIGFYGNTEDRMVDEDSAPGDDFSAELCKKWEEEANRAKDLGLRVVNLRTSFVLAKDGGALAQMVQPYKFFLGGPIGSGNQYMSWIHIKDYVALTLLALENEKITGPLNMASPNPVTNKEFSKTIGKILGKPSFVKVPAFILKLMLGEAASLILEGQRVSPKKALDNNFEYQFADLNQSLSDILS